MNDILREIAPYVVAVISVLGVIFTACYGLNSKLSAAYFNKMTDAYEQYYDCLIHFALHPDRGTQDALKVATYKAVLYASAEVSGGIQCVTTKALDCVAPGNNGISQLNDYLAELSVLFHEDVAHFSSRKARH